MWLSVFGGVQCSRGCVIIGIMRGFRGAVSAAWVVTAWARHPHICKRVGVCGVQGYMSWGVVHDEVCCCCVAGWGAVCNGGSGGDGWHVYYNYVGGDRAQEPWWDVGCDDLCTFRIETGQRRS